MLLLNKIAYHSTRQKGLNKFEDFTTDEKIDSGEGAHVHGWGLYLQADREKNENSYKMYLSNVVEQSDSNELSRYLDESDLMSMVEFVKNIKSMKSDDGSLTVNGKRYHADDSEDLLPISDYESIVPRNWYDDNDEPQTDVSDLCLDLLYDVGNKSAVMDFIEQAILDYNTDYKPTSNVIASQYEVEIPDDFVFVNEKENVSKDLFKLVSTEFGDGQTVDVNQIIEDYCERYVSEDSGITVNDLKRDVPKCYAFWINSLRRDGPSMHETYWVKEFLKLSIPEVTENYAWCILEIIQEYNDEVDELDIPKSYSFEYIYKYLTEKLGLDQKASQWLFEHGIDGIEYEGGRDDLCYVIFNCKDLRIVNEY